MPAVEASLSGASDNFDLARPAASPAMRQNLSDPLATVPGTTRARQR